MNKSKAVAVVETDPTNAAEVAALVKRCNTEKPAQADVAALRKALPLFPDMWERIGGGMTQQVLEGIISQPGAAPLVSEFWRQELTARRGRLGYDEAPEIERLLIDQVLVCAMRLSIIEHQYTQKWEPNSGLSLEVAEFWERRLSAAQRRYLRAVETLARVRQVTRQTVALQVNIATEGGQQVNVAGGDVKR